MCDVEAVFAVLGEVQLVDGRGLSAADLAVDDLLLVRSVTRVDEALLKGREPCFVGSATSGTDHLDRAWLRQAGIPFAYAPGCNANSVVEYVFSAISHCPGILEKLLNGGCLGIVGYGVIGRALQARCAQLGIHVLVNDPWLESTQLTTLEEVLDCDVVTLHAALTDRQPWPSRHLLGTRELRLLKPGSLLINAGRGPLIDSQALLAYLRAERPATVVLDVWEHEPAVDAALMALCRYATPHIAG